MPTKATMPTKAQLVALCRVRGIPVKGKTKELLELGLAAYVDGRLGEPGGRVAVLAAPDVSTVVATGTLAGTSSDPPALAPVPQVAAGVDARFVDDDDDDAGAGGSDDVRGPRDRDLSRYRVVVITGGSGPAGADAERIPPEASSSSSACALRDGRRRVIVVHVLRLRAADQHGDRQALAASAPLAPIDRILADRPHGASKHRSQQSALKHFGRFLQQGRAATCVRATSWADLTPGDVSQDLLERFASFLQRHSPTVQKHSTATNYLSQVHDALADRFKAGNPSLDLLDASWYRKVRWQMQKHYRQRSQTDGTAMVDRAPALHKEGVSVLCECLFGTVASSPKDVSRLAHDRVLFTVLWNILGRASEATFLEKQDLRFEPHPGCITIDVSRSKVQSEAPLRVFCERRSFCADVFHALGSQAALVPDHGATLFPLITGQSARNASAYVNKALSALLAGNDRLTTVSPSQGDLGRHISSSVSAHSFRRGAATHLAGALGMSLQTIAWRGGWNLEGSCTALEYIVGGGEGDIRAGRVLSGWPGGSGGGKPMSFSFAAGDAETMAAIDRFVKLLFGGNWDLWNGTSPGLLTVCAASILLYLSATPSTIRSIPCIAKSSDAATRCRCPGSDCSSGRP